MAGFQCWLICHIYSSSSDLSLGLKKRRKKKDGSSTPVKLCLFFLFHFLSFSELQLLHLWMKEPFQDFFLLKTCFHFWDNITLFPISFLSPTLVFAMFFYAAGNKKHIFLKKKSTLGHLSFYVHSLHDHVKQTELPILLRAPHMVF